jgi:DNA-binding NarL/FixJ family response regulator
MPPAPLRILLIDDHQIFRTGLRLILERAPGLTVVGEAGDAATALALALSTTPDVVVADIHLPGENGIELAVRIAAQCPAAKILFLSSDADLALVRRALDLGARGYLLKENAAPDLLRAIEAAAKGGIHLSPEVTAAFVQDYRQAGRSAAPAGPPRLSEREAEVLRLVADGFRNKEIATQLKVGTKSVETYRSRLMKKLGAHSPAELMRHAVREGLLPP